MLEFVAQYEKEMKRFKDSLELHTATMEKIKKTGGGYSEEGWTKLSEVAMVTKHVSV